MRIAYPPSLHRRSSTRTPLPWLLLLALTVAPNAPVQGEIVPGQKIEETAFPAENVYLLRNRESGEFLGLAPAGNLMRLELTGLQGSLAQLWAFQETGEGSFRIENVSRNAQPLKEEPGARGEDEDHLWLIKRLDTGYFHLIHAGSGRALGAAAGAVRFSEARGSLDQQWAVYTAKAAVRETHDFRMTGWAAAGPGTTGGAGGETVTVSTPEEFVKQISREEPLIIQIAGTLDFRDPPSGKDLSGRHAVTSDKTLLGLGKDARLLGIELRLRGVRNVIIRNLTLEAPADNAIAISTGTSHVWIDHCTISGAADGLIDITTGADFITVSWCRLHNANRMGLTGRVNDKATDSGAIRVTYHHNWFDNLNIRVPYGAWGRIHVFNNYYTNIHNNGIEVGAGARVVSEANYWNGARRSYLIRDEDEGWELNPGMFTDQASIFRRVLYDDQTIPDLEIGWDPPREYHYVRNHPLNVPRLVTTGAGAGIVDLGAGWTKPD